MLDTGVLRSSDLRSHLAEVLAQVCYHQRRYLVTRRGRPMAALVMPHELAEVEELARKTPAQKEYEHMARMDAWRRASMLDQVGLSGVHSRLASPADMGPLARSNRR